MKKAKLSGAIFLLAALVILMGGSSDVWGKACTLSGGGGTLGPENAGAIGDDFICTMDVDMNVVDVTRQPADAHVVYDLPYPTAGPLYFNYAGLSFLQDYRVTMSYEMSCTSSENNNNNRTLNSRGPVEDTNGGFIWWAAGDTCGPFATWFQNLLETDVANKLNASPGDVVLKEQTSDNETDLYDHFNIIGTIGGEGLIPDDPLRYHVEFIITKTE